MVAHFCIKVIDAEDNLVEVLPTTSGASAGLRLRTVCSTCTMRIARMLPSPQPPMMDKVEGLMVSEEKSAG